MQIFQIKEFIEYDVLEGYFYILKNNVKYRRLLPDEDGYLIFYRKSKKYKFKANKIAIELGNNIVVPKDKVVLHKNLDQNDYKLQNLRLVTRKVFNSIKEAQRNLSGYLKVLPHHQDVFSYTVQWREDGKDRILVLQDIVIARRLYTKLQLKYAKIISKWCISDWISLDILLNLCYNCLIIANLVHNAKQI